MSDTVRSVIRLIQCPKCSRPFRDAVRLPCGRSLCRTCLPPTHRRAHVTYPPLAGREEGLKCPFSAQFAKDEPLQLPYWSTKLHPCAAEHSLNDCAFDVTLNNIVSAFKEALGRKEETGIGAISHGHALDLVRAYALAEAGELPYHSIGHVDKDTVSALRSQETYDGLKSSIQDEVNCQLCFSLLMDPLTTDCGHTFCRSCLTRVVDHSNLCPFCRKELWITSTVQSEPGNIRLSEILHTLFFEELRDRVQAFNIEGLGYSEFTTLPLFIATLGFPSTRTFLHVFEIRYRALIHYALASGDRRFGLVMPNRAKATYGSSRHHEYKTYGTVMLIERAEDFPDGRIMIRAKGTSRFRILDAMLTSEGYISAQVQRVEDIPITDEELLEATETSHLSPIPYGGVAVNPFDRMSTEELLTITKDYVRECREKRVPWLSQRTFDAYGQPPTSAATYPYWLATILPITRHERYILLKTRSVRQRLKITAGWVKKFRSSEWYVCIPSGKYLESVHRNKTVRSACFFLAPLLVAFLASFFSGDPTQINLYIGPFAYSFTIGSSDFTWSQLKSFGFSSEQPSSSFRPELGYSPGGSSSWLRSIYGTAVTETESATYISKKLVFTVLAAVLIARAIRRLIDVARRKRAQQIEYAARNGQASGPQGLNDANVTTREGEGRERYEAMRNTEVLDEATDGTVLG
ncbi:hypothetical protein KEM56_003077 [Ascosphaera pollenicola]|nr:hypothetical protein KEM56_003077 [Ascosphaera pollenicola]